MDPSPQFSIVTPSYRQLEWLKLCAASVADQEGVTFEHIIQDAQSGAELEDWVKNHTSARLFSEQDSGMYDAVNRGFRRSKGQLCAYLNCDEQYLPGTLQRVSHYFHQHPEIDVLFGDAILTDANLNPLSYRRVIKPSRWHTLLRPLNVLTCSTFFRRKLIDEGVLFDPQWKMIGDRAWVLSFFTSGYRLATLGEPTSVFAFTGANLSNRPDVRIEYQRWAQRIPTWLRPLKPGIIAMHVLAKWRARAYVSRPISTSWFTKSSLFQRRKFEVFVGWRWPRHPG